MGCETCIPGKLAPVLWTALGVSARMAPEEGELFMECGFGPAVVLLQETPSLPSVKAPERMIRVLVASLAKG
jgi:hypothetical protein